MSNIEGGNTVKMGNMDNLLLQIATDGGVSRENMIGTPHAAFHSGDLCDSFLASFLDKRYIIYMDDSGLARCELPHPIPVHQAPWQ